jgi:hypothetical protein
LETGNFRQKKHQRGVPNKQVSVARDFSISLLGNKLPNNNRCLKTRSYFKILHICLPLRDILSITIQRQTDLPTLERWHLIPFQLTSGYGALWFWFSFASPHLLFYFMENKMKRKQKFEGKNNILKKCFTIILQINKKPKTGL